jgi:hypothetical protein
MLLKLANSRTSGLQIMPGSRNLACRLCQEVLLLLKLCLGVFVVYACG